MPKFSNSWPCNIWDGKKEHEGIQSWRQIAAVLSNFNVVPPVGLDKVQPGGAAASAKDIPEGTWKNTTNRCQRIPQRPSSLFIDGLLYGIHDTGVLTCRDPKTGDPIWRHRLGGNFAASPVYAGGLIYIPNDAGITHVIRPGRKFDSVAVNELDHGGYASPAVAYGSIFLRTRKHLYRLTDQQLKQSLLDLEKRPAKRSSNFDW